jgi:hypothetical protein
MARPFALLLAVAAALAVAGCARPVAGSARPDASAAKDATAPLTGQLALGDFPTVDYCSLLVPLTLPDTLGSLVLMPRPSYDYCTFKVRTQGIDVRVRVGHLDDGDPPGSARRTPDKDRTLPRGMRVERERDQPDRCTRYLTFTDNISLMVQADSATGEHVGHGDWCPIVEATVSVVVDRVLGKRVKHYEFEPRSVGRLEACDLVAASVLAAKLGVPRMQTVRFPSTHTCLWSAVGGTGPNVVLVVAPDESTYDADLSKQETIAGWPTTVTPHRSLPMCQLETTAGDSPQLGTREQVLIEVVLRSDGNDACGPGRALAAEVWAKLPR